MVTGIVIGYATLTLAAANGDDAPLTFVEFFDPTRERRAWAYPFAAAVKRPADPTQPPDGCLTGFAALSRRGDPDWLVFDTLGASLDDLSDGIAQSLLESVFRDFRNAAGSHGSVPAILPAIPSRASARWRRRVREAWDGQGTKVLGFVEAPAAAVLGVAPSRSAEAGPLRMRAEEQVDGFTVVHAFEVTGSAGGGAGHPTHIRAVAVERFPRRPRGPEDRDVRFLESLPATPTPADVERCERVARGAARLQWLHEHTAHAVPTLEYRLDLGVEVDDGAFLCVSPRHDEAPTTRTRALTFGADDGTGRPRTVRVMGALSDDARDGTCLATLKVPSDEVAEGALGMLVIRRLGDDLAEAGLYSWATGRPLGEVERFTVHGQAETRTDSRALGGDDLAEAPGLPFTHYESAHRTLPPPGLCPPTVSEYRGAALWAIPNRLDFSVMDGFADSSTIAVCNAGTVDVGGITVRVRSADWLTVSTDHIPRLPHGARGYPLGVTLDLQMLPARDTSAEIEIAYQWKENTPAVVDIAVAFHAPPGPCIWADGDGLDFSTAAWEGRRLVKLLTLRNLGPRPAQVALTPSTSQLAVDPRSATVMPSGSLRVRCEIDWRDLREQAGADGVQLLVTSDGGVTRALPLKGVGAVRPWRRWRKAALVLSVLLAFGIAGLMARLLRPEPGSCAQREERLIQEQDRLLFAARQAAASGKIDRAMELVRFILDCESHSSDVEAAAEIERQLRGPR